MSDKLKFFIRALLYIGLAFVGPIIATLNHYEIHQKSKMNVVGIIVILIIVFGLIKLGNYVIKAFGYNYISQLVKGFLMPIIPILFTLMFIDYVAENIVMFKQIFIVVLFCEIGAVIVNPFPKWVYQKNLAKLKKELSK